MNSKILYIFFFALCLFHYSCGGTNFTGASSRVERRISNGNDANASETTLKSISLLPDTLTIPKGETAKLALIGIYNDGHSATINDQAQWNIEKSDTLTSRDNENGSFVGKNLGLSGVAANIGNLSATAQITVTDAKLVDFVVEAVQNRIPVGLSSQVKAFAIYSDGTKTNVTENVVWELSDNTAADIDNNQGTKGKIHAIKPGTVEVRANYLDRQASTTIKVIDAIVVSMDIKPANPTVYTNERKAFTVVRKLSDGSEADISSDSTWTSSDTRIAVADLSAASGVFKGISSGSSRIHVDYTYNGENFSAETSLNIKPLADKCLDASASKSTQNFSVVTPADPQPDPNDPSRPLPGPLDIKTGICEWGNNGNGAAINGQMSARREEYIPMTLSHNGVTCSVEINSAIPEFSFDDYIIFTLGANSRNFIFANSGFSRRYMQTIGFETSPNSNLFEYDWLKLSGQRRPVVRSAGAPEILYIGDYPDESYCAGGVCVIPDVVPGTSYFGGALTLQPSAQWFQSLPFDLALQKNFDLGIIVVGDNDYPGAGHLGDCIHTQFKATVTFKYVTANDAIQ